MEALFREHCTEAVFKNHRNTLTPGGGGRVLLDSPTTERAIPKLWAQFPWYLWPISLSNPDLSLSHQPYKSLMGNCNWKVLCCVIGKATVMPFRFDDPDWILYACMLALP